MCIRDRAKKGDGFQSVGLIVIAACAFLYGIYEILPDSGKSKLSEKQSTGTYPVGELVSNRVDDRAFAYVPAQSFGVCSFSSLRMVEEVGMPKIIPDELLARVPFLKDMVWDPESCGVKPNGRALYFMQLPSESYQSNRPGDVLFGLILPIGSDEKVKNFILSQLDLKAQKPNWKVRENKLPDFHSIHHKSAHISVGLDQNCLVLLLSLIHI